MDEAECAEKYEQDERDRMLEKAHAAAVVEIPLEYVCRECGEPTTGGRWCGAGCRDIYVRRSGI